VRRKIGATIAASVLTLAIAAPALAGAPTYSATATCDVAGPEEFGPATKGAIRLMVVAWSIENGCGRNTVETTYTPA